MSNCRLAKDFHLPRQERNPDRDRPANRQQAMCFTLHDILVSMYGVSILTDPGNFDYFLSMMEANIASYREITEAQ